MRRSNAEVKNTQGSGEEGEEDRERQDQAVEGFSQPPAFVEIAEEEEEPFPDSDGTPYE
jgi:hypothetical protein